MARDPAAIGVLFVVIGGLAGLVCLWALMFVTLIAG